MSEMPTFGQPEHTEQAAVDFLMECAEWEQLINNPVLTEAEIKAVKQEAIEALDAIHDTRDESMIAWGAAIIVVESEKGKYYMESHNFDTPILGLSRGVSVIPTSFDRNKRATKRQVVHQITFAHERDGQPSLGIAYFDYNDPHCMLAEPLEERFFRGEPNPAHRMKKGGAQALSVAEELYRDLSTSQLNYDEIAELSDKLEKQTIKAEHRMESSQLPVTVSAERGYVLELDSSGKMAYFEPIVLAGRSLGAYCITLSSFESIQLAWPEHAVKLPDEDVGLCLCLDIFSRENRAKLGIQPKQVLYVPMARNIVEYVAHVNAANEGGQS